MYQSVPSTSKMLRIQKRGNKQVANDITDMIFMKKRALIKGTDITVSFYLEGIISTVILRAGASQERRVAPMIEGNEGTAGESMGR